MGFIKPGTLQQLLSGALALTETPAGEHGAQKETTYSKEQQGGRSAEAQNGPSLMVCLKKPDTSHASSSPTWLSAPHPASPFCLMSPQSPPPLLVQRGVLATFCPQVPIP
jgi:hypothetical protein